MLNVVEYGKDGYEFPALLVLGCFDAIHVGHRELLKKAKLQAKINGLDLGVMMFRDGKNGKLLYSFEERVALLEEFNVKFVLAVDFNDEFKKITPLDFLHTVEELINVKAYMSGKDFRFGAQAKGKSSTLKNYAEDEENGVWYMSVKDVDLNGEKVSTTLIKACLDEGNVAKANELLGTEFSTRGEVVKGEGRGASVVGFPTVNIFYPEWKHPIKHGVYGVKSVIDGTEYNGIANFGNCPTFGDDRVCLEVYFEGFSGDLYGQTLTVKFTDYIRDIEEFSSAEELSSQIQNDLLTVAEETVVADEEQIAEEPVVEEQTAEESVAEVVEEQSAVEVEEEIVEEQAAEEIVETVVEEQSADDITEEVVIEEPVDELVEEAVFDDLDGFDETVEEVVEDTEDTVEVSYEVIDEQPVEEIAEEETQPEQEVVEEFITEEQTAEETLEEVIEEPAAEEEIVEEQPVEELVGEPVEENTEETTETENDGGEENLD